MLIHKLRIETAYQHQELEDRLNLFERVKDIASYTHLLVRFLGFIAPFEARLQKSCSRNLLGLDLAIRAKTPLLKDDLKYLGKNSEPSYCSLKELPSLGSLAQVLGALYVMEGSTLGAQVICRHLGPKLNLGAGTGLSFFYGHGEQTHTRWQEFQAFMHQTEKEHLDPRQVPQAVQAAQETFYKLGLWLCPEQELEPTALPPLAHTSEQRELCSKL